MGTDHNTERTGMLQRVLHYGPGLFPFAIAAVLVAEHVGGSYWAAYPERAYRVLDGVSNGGTLLAVVLVLILAGKPAWKWVFAGVALLATFRLVRFQSSSFGLDFGLVKIDLICFSLLFFHLALNTELLEPVKAWLRAVPESQEAKQQRFEEAVNGYRARYRTTPRDELQRLLERGQLATEAQEAVRRVLKEQ
jgi:hypothetical protein